MHVPLLAGDRCPPQLLKYFPTAHELGLHAVDGQLSVSPPEAEKYCPETWPVQATHVPAL